jgi:hypothetical protein
VAKLAEGRGFEPLTFRSPWFSRPVASHPSGTPLFGEGGWIEHPRDLRPGYWLATRHLTARAFLRMTSFPDGAAAVPVMRRPDRNLRATRGRPGLGSNRRQSCAQRSCHAYHSLTSNFAARIGKSPLGGRRPGVKGAHFCHHTMSNLLGRRFFGALRFPARTWIMLGRSGQFVGRADGLERHFEA